MLAAGCGAGCATTHYAAPSAAQLADDALPSATTYPVFKNRKVTVRVLDNRIDRPQSVVLVDGIRGLVDRALKRAQVGDGPEAPAVFEVRITRYVADAELSKWKACVGFAVTVEIAPAVRHDVATERCAVTTNVWGTESADLALREAFREGSRDLLMQVDGLPAPAPPPAPAVSPAPAVP